MRCQVNPLIRILLEGGADVHRRYPLIQNRSLIEYACVGHCNLELFELVMSHVDSSRLHNLGCSGMAPIHFLVSKWGGREVSTALQKLEIFLRRNPDVNARAQNDTAMPLLKAARAGFLEGAILLLKYRANVNARNDLGWGVAAYAILSCNSRFLEYLENSFQESDIWSGEHTLDIVFTSPKPRWNPPKSFRCSGCNLIHVAVSVRNLHALEQLVQSGRYQGIHKPCAEGYAPLHLAASVNATDAAALLL